MFSFKKPDPWPDETLRRFCNQPLETVQINYKRLPITRVPDNVSIKDIVSSEAAITSSLIFTGKTSTIYYGYKQYIILYRVLIITINTHGHNIIVYTPQSWHVCGDVYALSTYTKYKYAKHGSDAHTTSAEVEETLFSAPAGSSLFIFFLLLFLSLRAVFSFHRRLWWCASWRSSKQNIYIYTLHTHTRSAHDNL